MDGGKMGAKEGTYLKSLKKLQDAMKKKDDEKAKIREQFMEVVKKERKFWTKQGFCTICLEEGDTEWHHIISQNRCKEIGKEYLVHSRTNVVEVCRACHDQTTASLRRKHIDSSGGNKSVKNPHGPVTNRQTEYIKTLGGIERLTPEMTRGEASALIDELKAEAKN